MCQEGVVEARAEGWGGGVQGCKARLVQRQLQEGVWRTRRWQRAREEGCSSPGPPCEGAHSQEGLDGAVGPQRLCQLLDAAGTGHDA